MMFFSKTTAFLILITLMLYSCTKATFEEEMIVDVNNVTFNPTIKNLLVVNCDECHSGTAPIGGFTLEIYDEVRFHSESGTLLDRINDLVNPMPQSALMGANSRALFQQWAHDGYQEN